MLRSAASVISGYVAYIIVSYILLERMYGMTITTRYLELTSFNDVPFAYFTLHLTGFVSGIVTAVIYRKRMWLNLTLLSALLVIPNLIYYSDFFLNFMNRFLFINFILAPVGVVTSGLLMTRIYKYRQKRNSVVDETELA